MDSQKVSPESHFGFSLRILCPQTRTRAQIQDFFLFQNKICFKFTQLKNIYLKKKNSTHSPNKFNQIIKNDRKTKTVDPNSPLSKTQPTTTRHQNPNSPFSTTTPPTELPLSGRRVQHQNTQLRRQDQALPVCRKTLTLSHRRSRFSLGSSTRRCVR